MLNPNNNFNTNDAKSISIDDFMKYIDLHKLIYVIGEYLPTVRECITHIAYHDKGAMWVMLISRATITNHYVKTKITF